MCDIEIEVSHINNKKCWDRMLLRASSDPEFRNKLLAKPNEALLSCGIEMAASVRITIHEFDPSHQHIFLPPLGAPIAKPGITLLNQKHIQIKGDTNG